MQTHVNLPLIIIHEYTLTCFTSFIVHRVPTQQVQCALWLNPSSMRNNRPIKISYVNCHVVVDVVTTHMWSCALHGSNLWLHTILSVAVTNHIRFSNVRGYRRNFLSWLCSELSVGSAPSRVQLSVLSRVDPLSDLLQAVKYSAWPDSDSGFVRENARSATL